ncbi:MAG: hypothetical protein KQ78_01874 [Candidatus Izimaplasma bacterium HR2]|nr:MAG: hypothetical protein KQ78_01874 [Candidatus Izimaplasma bacterium HR2]
MSLSKGTVEEFATGISSCKAPTVCTLTSTKALTTFEDDSDSDYAKGCVLDISGTTITAGTVQTFGSISSQYHSNARITDSTVLAAYGKGSSEGGDIVVLTISGTTITAGTIVNFSPGITVYNTNVIMLTATKGILFWRPTGSLLRVQVVNISGTTITLGATSYALTETAAYFIPTRWTQPISTNGALYMYKDFWDSLVVGLISVSGDVITAEDTITPISSISGIGGIGKLSDTRMIIAYYDSTPLKSEAILIEITGTSSLTTGDSLEFPDTSDANNQSVTAITSSVVIIAYDDEDTDDTEIIAIEYTGA